MLRGQTPNQVIGTGTNDNAAAGIVGEFITATVAVGGAVALVTATANTVTSITLTPGDWDMSATIDYNLTGATVTDFRGGPSLNAALPPQIGGTIGTGTLGTDSLAINPSNFATITDVLTLQIPPVRLQVLNAASAIVNLIAQATFSVGTVSAFGTIRARRMR